MRDYVNRRTREFKDYSPNTSSRYSDLDYIATTLLRIAWSRKPDSPETQNAVNYDCVAVCVVNGDLWYASNIIQITDEDVNTLLDCMEKDRFPFDGDVYMVSNGKGHMHAEMKLVSQLIQEGLKTDSIGVSKPCCAQCANELSKRGINYSMWHDDSVANWESPI